MVALTETFLEKALSLGIDAARKAEKIVMGYFENGAEVVNSKEQVDKESKHYKSPATIADQKAESMIKDAIKKIFPDHGFLGEEEGCEGDSDYTWIIDPIDGTKAFMRGMDDWAILIALQYKNEIVLGVSLMPLFDELIYASKGGGCYCNEKKCIVSSRSIEDAFIVHERYKYFKREKMVKNLEQVYDMSAHYIANKTPRQFHYFLQGKIEAIFGPPDLYLYDFAAYDIMVTESGGRFTTLAGDPVYKKRTSFIATNGIVHEDILKCFRS